MEKNLQFHPNVIWRVASRVPMILSNNAVDEELVEGKYLIAIDSFYGVNTSKIKANWSPLKGDNYS